MSSESSQEVNDGTISARVMSEINNQGYSVWKDELAKFAGARSSLKEWAEEKGLDVFFHDNSYVIHKEGVDPREVLDLASQGDYDISDEEIELEWHDVDETLPGDTVGRVLAERHERRRGQVACIVVQVVIAVLEDEDEGGWIDDYGNPLEVDGNKIVKWAHLPRSPGQGK